MGHPSAFDVGSELRRDFVEEINIVVFHLCGDSRWTSERWVKSHVPCAAHLSA